MRSLRYLAAVQCTSAFVFGQVTLMESIESALRRNPRLAIEREQVELARAQQSQATATFDPQISAQLLQNRNNLPLTGLQRLTVLASGLTTTAQTANQTTGASNATLQLRSGVGLSSSVNLTRNTDNLAQTQGVNLAQVRFQAAIPLLRGRGRSIVASEEIAGNIEVLASLRDVNHAAATLIADTAARYWELAAAEQSIAVLKDAEERGRLLVSTVRALIGVRPVAQGRVTARTRQPGIPEYERRGR
jgi:outer membrane protein TolC